MYGGNQVRGLTPSVVQYRAGGDPSTAHKSPGRMKYEPITLERGPTQDVGFHYWASQVSQFGSQPGAEVSLANFRNTIYLEVYNGAGKLATSYEFVRSWVSRYQAVPKLGGGTKMVAIEQLEIMHEGLLMAPARRLTSHENR